MDTFESLRQRAEALRLHGLLAHWQEVAAEPWVAGLLDWEEAERARRSLERRLQEAHIGRFKPLCDFDWGWPARIDRAAVEALMSLDFLKESANGILIGPSGIGKSMLARNIAHQAIVHGATVLFATAGQLLGELASLDSDSALRRRLRHYAAPAGHRRGRLPVLLQPPRRPAVRTRQPPLRAKQHPGHHQPALRRVARGLPQRGLRRPPRRPPRPQRRGRRH